MPSLLELTSQGDVGTISDESKLSSVKLMTPQQLYELWERQNWQSHTIDFTQDKRDWAGMDEELRGRLAWNLSSFFVGEERVTTCARPLYSFTPIVPLTRSLTRSMYASRSARSGSHHSPAYTRYAHCRSSWGLNWFSWIVLTSRSSSWWAPSTIAAAGAS